LNEHEFRCDGNPCLTWCAANVVAVEDPTLAKKYDKKRSTGRIDGIVAIVMACGILQDAMVSAYDGMTEEEMIARMTGDFEDEDDSDEDEDEIEEEGVEDEIDNNRDEGDAAND